MDFHHLPPQFAVATRPVMDSPTIRTEVWIRNLLEGFALLVSDYDELFAISSGPKGDRLAVRAEHEVAHVVELPDSFRPGDHKPVAVILRRIGDRLAVGAEDHPVVGSDP